MNNDEWIDEYGVTYSIDKKRLIKVNKKLTNYYIIEGCEIIGKWAFTFCKDSIRNIFIPDSVILIEGWAFDTCSNLKSITIPNSVTSIGILAFKRCFGLTNITIPNSVTSIGSGAFYQCKRLTKVTIGKNVTYIGDNAFCLCSEQIEIHFTSQIPPIIIKSDFQIGGLTLYVPSGTKEAYQKAWSFDNIIYDNIIEE